MRILVLSQYWYPDNGVPQRRWEWLTEILKEQGHEVVALVSPPRVRAVVERKLDLRSIMRIVHQASGGQVGPAGETVVYAASASLGMSISGRAFSQLITAISMLSVGARPGSFIRKYSPELIIGTVPAIPTGFVAWAMSTLLRAPYVIDLRDAWPDMLFSIDQWNESLEKVSLRERVFRKSPAQIVLRVAEYFINQIVARADGVIVTSGVFARELERRLPRARQGERPIRVVRNVFPVRSETNTESSTEKTDLGDDSNAVLELNVLYAGTLGRAQYLQNAIDAAELALSRGVHIRLRLVGAGAAREALERLAKHSPADIQVLNQKPAHELADLYRWADTALVHLADWPGLRFAVPSKTFEFMRIGKHITGVLRGEAAELISTLNAGDVVDPGDPAALAELWEALATHRERLNIGPAAAKWLSAEKHQVAPFNLLTIIDEVGSKNYGASR